MTDPQHGPGSPSPLRERLRLAWRILHGQPVAYRLTINGGITVKNGSCSVYRCDIIGGAPEPADLDGALANFAAQWGLP